MCAAKGGNRKKKKREEERARERDEGGGEPDREAPTEIKRSPTEREKKKTMGLMDTDYQSSAQRSLPQQRRHPQRQHTIIRHKDDLLPPRRPSIRRRPRLPRIHLHRRLHEHARARQRRPSSVVRVHRRRILCIAMHEPAHTL